MNNVELKINVVGNANQSLLQISQSNAQLIGGFTKTQTIINNFANTQFGFNNIVSGLSNMMNSIDNAIRPGIAFNTTMKELESLTGVTGKSLNAIGDNARRLAKTFGTEASASAQAYTDVLSRLGPDIAKSPVALDAMGKSIMTLSKTMQGDVNGAMDALTTGMLQYNISLQDPLKASEEMSKMMNVMAAGAKVGSATVPQVSETLKVAGAAAYSSKLSFEEFNAAIQVMGKGGKYGAEAGTNLRNVLSTLGEGRFLPKDTQEELMRAGVSVARLGDTTIPLKARLEELKKIQGDTALVSKLFGKENASAAMILLNNTQDLEGWTKEVSNTNTATEMAGVVMGSFAERMNRMKAFVDNLKISFFNTFGGMVPYLKGMVSAFQGAASIMQFFAMASTFSELAWTKAIKNRISKTYSGIKSLTLSGIATGAWSVMAGIATIATHGLANAFKAVSKAIYSIPLIGWILLGVSLLVEGFMLLWEKVEGFRRILFGVWEVIKLVFSWIWEGIKWYLGMVWAYWKFVFNILKTIVMGIVDAFVWVWNGIVAGFKWVWNIVLSAFNFVTGMLGGIWTFIKENVIDPILNAFSKMWDFIKGIFSKIADGMSAVFAPIVSLWNKIFGGESKIAVAYKVGAQKGSESFKNSHKKEGAGGLSLSMPDMATAEGTNNQLFTNNKTGAGLKPTSDSISAGGKSTKVINIDIKEFLKIGTQQFINGQDKVSEMNFLKEMQIGLESLLNDAQMAM